VVAILAVVASRQRVERRRVFRTTTAAPVPVQGIPPVEQWTATFQRLGPEELAELLTQIETKHPDLYAKWNLGYLHARALLEDDEPDDAAKKLAPFLAKESPYRPLALYHQSTTQKGDAASRTRQTLIFELPKSTYREQAIDEEIEYLSTNRARLAEFATKLMPSAPTARRRELRARLIQSPADAFALLNGGTSDDAADRAARWLDRPQVLGQLNPQQLAVLGETMQAHRHFDRATAILQMALSKIYSDDLQFAAGRCYFGNEQYAEAERAYLRGANATKDARQKSTFLWHAARAAQLRGDDATAERLMTAAIAVPGKFETTTVALTQRIRTRIHAKRVAEAAADLALVRKLAPNERALLEASLAYAVGNLGSAVSVLNSVPPKLLDDYDRAELAYWRARALESRDPAASFREYLTVLRSRVPTHYAYLARGRLDAAEMAPRLARELATREAQVANLIAAKQFETAKQVQTDRILLSSRDRAAQLQKLATIYRELPAYRAVLELKPKALPQFPIDSSDRDTLLLAMGLADEATDAIESRFGLAPAQEALTRSLALNLGGASRESIYAIEVMMKRVPQDFVPDLLPLVVRQLLYPRYFYDAITGDAGKYDADPVLLLSIMREESRFNPRAKSQAAARGLLQFIITTARDIGRDVGLVDLAPEDLYDPRVIIQLGAKYVAELMGQFDANRYATAAAYNAGPKQVALWRRLQAAPGDDAFLAAINFDETKHYVRKVMNSYARYGEIYGKGAPAGGLRVEP
jgi:Transglycosylase SLT domain